MYFVIAGSTYTIREVTYINEAKPPTGFPKQKSRVPKAKTPDRPGVEITPRAV